MEGACIGSAVAGETGRVEVARLRKKKRNGEAAATRMPSLVSCVSSGHTSSSQRSWRGNGRGTGDKGVDIDPGWDH